MAEYLDNCNIFEDNSLQNRVQNYWKTQYGLNRRSVLTEIDFPVTTNIVQDVMHVLLEGCFGNVLALFVKRSGDVGDFDLDWLNNELQIFPYAYQDKCDKPKHIADKDIDDGMYVRQKAATSLMLAYVLPLILGRKVDLGNRYYRNILGICQIIQLSFSAVVDRTSIGELQQLIQSYFVNFKDLYPDASVKPKMHFMLHFVQQIEDFGPLRNQNCMRFEAKHGYFVICL